jgi:hypothetical protein
VTESHSATTNVTAQTFLKTKTVNYYARPCKSTKANKFFSGFPDAPGRQLDKHETATLEASQDATNDALTCTAHALALEAAPHPW